MRNALLLLALAGVLTAMPARAQFGGVVSDPLVEANTAKSLLESIKQNFTMATQVKTLAQGVAYAQQQIQLLRDTYANVNAVASGDVSGFLQGQAAYFESRTTPGRGYALIKDLQMNGLNGGSGYAAFGEVSVGDQLLAQQVEKVSNRPWSTAQAIKANDEVESAILDPSLETEIHARDLATPVEGLFDIDAARRDPALLALYTQRAHTGAAWDRSSVDLLKKVYGSGSITLGEATGVTAKASAITAKQETTQTQLQAQQLLIHEAERGQQLDYDQQSRKELDDLAEQTANALQAAYAQPVTNYSTAPSLEDK